MLVRQVRAGVALDVGGRCWAENMLHLIVRSAVPGTIRTYDPEVCRGEADACTSRAIIRSVHPRDIRLMLRSPSALRNLVPALPEGDRVALLAQLVH